MKKYARLLVISFLSFTLIAYLYPGFNYNHDLVILALAGGFFALLNIFVKPIIKLLSLPFNILTFGFFSFLVNVIILYGVTYFVNSFKIISFHFAGFTFSGFLIPAYDFNQLTSALLASFLIGFSSTILFWLFR